MFSAGSLLLSSILVTISLDAERLRSEDELRTFPKKPPDFGLPKKEVFDFVIVGGGTAGLILANRLSENFTVLVLEGGGDPPPIQNVATINFISRDAPEINFLYQTQPERNAGRETKGRVLISGGKMLGGSSSHNDMAWERCNPYDFDNWAKITKDDSWKYENIVKYYIKIENYTGIFPADKGQRGTQGPFHVSEDTYAPGNDIWLQAGRELGYEVRDPNGPQKIGFSPKQFSKIKGRRVSTYTAYFLPLMQENNRRKNLKVYRYSYVSKVILEGSKAVGVEYKRHGIPRAAFAAKEVILSAGTFISPVILIKSGIGPADQVKVVNAKLVKELPVGKNLQDHPSVVVSPFYVSKPEYSWNLENNVTFDDIKEFEEEGTGVMTAALQEGEAYITSLRSLFSLESIKSPFDYNKWPDIQVYYSAYGGDPKDRDISCKISNLRPVSRGVLKVNTSATSMEDNYLPILDYNYYSVESEFETTIEGINFCLRILETTPAFRSIGATFGLKPYPPCLLFVPRSRAYWRCYIRHKTGTGYHSVGTCSMGSGPEDPKAVVDSKLRVIGIENLRVVDASIMPQVPNANTLAPTMMIAEKAAEDILKHHEQ